MIKINEVRIGNWFSYNEADEEMQIDTTDFQYVINGNITDIEPIPLTEEWLIKFGFDSLYINKNGFSFIFEKIGSDLICHIEDSIILEIKYVHQLQNLYFALTGQELTITH